MGLFSKPVITPHEFKKQIRRDLYSKGFSRKQLNEVEKVFRGDLSDKSPSSSFEGLDSKEIEGGVKWLRENPDKHKLSQDKISMLEESLRRHNK